MDRRRELAAQVAATTGEHDDDGNQTTPEWDPNWAEERPSLLERMIHLANLRGAWTGATNPSAARDRAADAYITALEDEVERHGIVVRVDG